MCKVNGTMKSPEGMFPVVIELHGFDPVPGTEGGGRQWQVAYHQTGYVARNLVRLTPYGWYLNQLDSAGGEYGRRFIVACGANPVQRVAAFREYVRPDDPTLRPLSPATSAALGPPALVGWVISPRIQGYVGGELFRRPGGANPSDDQKAEFVHLWTTFGIARAGERLRDSTDLADQLSITDTAVEVRIPVELPASGPGIGVTAARGRVVVVCTDPEVLDTVKRLRETAADPARATSSDPPVDLPKKPTAWRVTRLESDLRKVVLRQPMQPDGAPPEQGGPGGPTP
jgi:hypothetical protein